MKDDYACISVIAIEIESIDKHRIRTHYNTIIRLVNIRHSEVSYPNNFINQSYEYMMP